MPKHNLSTAEIYIHDSKDGYKVRIRLDEVGVFGGFLSPDSLPPWVSSTDAVQYGQRLFNTLFADNALREAWGAMQGNCRVCLWLDTQTPELHALPWELLHDGRTFLAAGADTPFSRYLNVAKAQGKPVTERPIRVLAAISDPDDLAGRNLAPVGAPAERKHLEAAFADIPSSLLRLEFLDTLVTPGRIEDALYEYRPHILHLTMHGVFNDGRGQAALYLQDSAGKTRIVTDADFANIFERLGQDRPRLIFLAACESAARSTEDVFAGVAPQLVQVGVPAVVAMQDQIVLATMRKLTSTFYKELFRHGEVDRALNAARSLLLTEQTPDAGIPVLLMRLKDGRLWQNDMKTASYHIPFQCSTRQESFIPRPEITDAIKRRLLGDTALSGVCLVSVLCGMGGIGKSTLVTELCWDKDIQARFPDGILWVTLRQQPKVLDLLEDWIKALGDSTYIPTTENTETLSLHLQTLLKDKAVLLVIDDAWQIDHINPFLVGNEHSQVLITTRDRSVVSTLDAELYELEMLTPTQSETLLCGRLRRSLTIPERKLALTLAEAVGYLPLALSLIAAQISRKTSWEELLSDLRREVALLESLDVPGSGRFMDEAKRKLLSLKASFNLSVKWLDQKLYGFFAWLGIFAEDAIINPLVAAMLWRTDERTARDYLRILFENSLLLATEPIKIGGKFYPAYRLHSLVRDFARQLLTTPHPDGLGTSLGDAEAKLLDYYFQHTDGTWATVPDDGYIVEHLLRHLEDQKRNADIHQIMADSRWAGRRSKSDLLLDFYQARRLATLENDPTAYLRYTIFESVLQSMYEELPIEIFPTAAAQRLVNARWLEIYVRGMKGDALAKMRVYLSMRQELGEDICPKPGEIILKIAAAISPPETCADMLFQLIEAGLTEAQQPIACQNIWRAAFDCKYHDDQQTIIKRLLPLLSQDELMQLRQEALVYEREIVLGVKIRDIETTFAVLSCVIPILPETQEKTVQILWRQAKARNSEGEALSDLVRYLPKEYIKPEWIEEMWETLSHLDGWEFPSTYYGIVKDMLPHVLGTHLYEAWEKAKREGDSEGAAQTECWGGCVGLILPYLPDSYVKDNQDSLRDLVRRFSSSYSKLNPAQALIARLESIQKNVGEEQKAVDVAADANESVQAAALELSPDAAWESWQKTIDVLGESGCDQLSALLHQIELERLTQRIPAERITEAINICLHLLSNGKSCHLDIIPQLAARLPVENLDEFWQNVIKTVLNIEDESNETFQMAVALAMYAPQSLREAYLRIVFDAIDAIDVPDKKTWAEIHISKNHPQVGAALWLHEWAVAFQRQEVGEIQRLISRRLEFRYPHMTPEQRKQLDETDWQAQVWDEISPDWDLHSAQGWLILLRHTPREFKLRIWEKSQVATADLRLDVIRELTMMLFPLLPRMEKKRILPEIIKHSRHSEIIKGRLGTWPGPLIWEAWQCSLNGLNTDNVNEYSDWLTLLAGYVPKDRATIAWGAILEKIRSFRYDTQFLVMASLVERLPTEDVILAYQKFSQANTDCDLSRHDEIEKALLKRMPGEQLPRLFEEATCSFPEYRWLTWRLDQRVRFRTSSLQEEMLSESAHPSGMRKSLLGFIIICIASITAYVLIPAWVVWNQVSAPLRWMRRIFKSLLQSFVDTLYIEGDSRIGKRLWMFRRILLPLAFVIDKFHFLFKEPEESGIYGLFAELSSWLANEYFMSRKEALIHLKKVLSDTDGSSRLEALVRARFILQRLGGKKLRIEVQQAYEDAATWWLQAIKIKQ